MADEPKTPQQLIDDAAQALGTSPIITESEEQPKLDAPEQLPPSPEPAQPIPEPPVLPQQETVSAAQPSTPPMMTAQVEPSPVVPTTPVESSPLPPLPPTPEPEAMVIPSKEKDEEERKKSDQKPPQTPEKKKSGKGVLIATLLFFILTLPIAIYYVVQSPQFTEIRSRASGGRCSSKTGLTGSHKIQCEAIECESYTSSAGCNSSCCIWTAVTIPTSTPTTKAGGSPTPTTKSGSSPTPTKKSGGSPTPTTGGGGGGGTTTCHASYTTGSCAGKPATNTFCPLDCGNLCCNRNDQVCCCMGCFPKDTDCSKAPYNCENPPTVGCPKTTCYTGYPGTDVPHENCLICTPDRSKLNTVTFSSDGTVRIHMDNVASGTTVSLSKDGNAASMTKISEGNFNAVVSAGTYTISVNLGNEDNASLGFIQPDGSNKCGRYDPNNKRDISSSVSALSSYDITTTSGVNYPYECWADAIQGEDSDQRGQLDANYDFNDFDLIIGYTATVTNTPTPGPTNTPVPTATPTPTTTYVYNYPTNTPAPTKVRLIAQATEAPVTTPTSQPTPKIPVAGVGPGLIGTLSVAGSVILLLLGLAL